MRRLLVTLGVVAATTLLGPARPAYACTCLATSADRLLRSADAAFVGRALSWEEPPREPGRPYHTGAMVPYVFAVERTVKGSLGPTVTVVSSLEGASCGLGTSSRRTGLFLRRGEDGQWHSGLCSKVEAGELLRAGRDRELHGPLTAGAVVLLGAVAYTARRSVRRSG